MSRGIALASPLNNPEALPLVGIEALVEKNTNPILIVAPHPDDETLGCGGAIALLRQLNVPVKVLIVSDGTKSHPNSLLYPAPVLKKLRKEESLSALAILGVEPEAVTFWGLPDGAVDRNQASQSAIASNYLLSIKPAVIFLPWRNDPHADHRASWELIEKISSNLLPSTQLIEYPIWDWDTAQRQSLAESVHAWRLDLSGVLDLKRSAISRYRSQISNLIDDDPHGFRLTPEMLENFTQPWEVYLEVYD